MKRFYISYLVLIIGINLHAQQASPAPSVPPLPPGPLLKRAPDYSAWTVTYQGHPIEEKEAVKPPATGEEKPKNKQSKEPVTTLSSVVKTASTILEQNVDAAGQRHQVWHVSSIRIVAGPGSRGLSWIMQAPTFSPLLHRGGREQRPRVTAGPQLEQPGPEAGRQPWPGRLDPGPEHQYAHAAHIARRSTVHATRLTCRRHLGMAVASQPPAHGTCGVTRW